MRHHAPFHPHSMRSDSSSMSTAALIWQPAALKPNAKPPALLPFSVEGCTGALSRQQDLKSRTLSTTICDKDHFSTMRLSELFGNRQAHAPPAFFERIKWLKDA